VYVSSAPVLVGSLIIIIILGIRHTDWSFEWYTSTVSFKTILDHQLDKIQKH